MRKLIVLIFVLASCYSEPKKDKSYIDTVYVTKQATQDISNGNESKFLYVDIKATSPRSKILHSSILYLYMDTVLYKSDIKEVANYTEDDRYRYLDNYEKEVNEDIIDEYHRFLSVEQSMAGPSIKNVINLISTPKIVKKQCYVLNSYRAAYKQKDRDTGQYLEGAISGLPQ